MGPDFQYTKADLLDGFKIVEPLYAGALAQVYRGIDTLTHQTVVIKVPSMDIVNNPLVYYHYQNEVQVLGRITHPRIVRLIQRDRSMAYSVFEYIPGMDLRKRMNAAGIMSLLKAKHYVTQIAQGLEYLHNCSIIHLDIKPENIMITPMDTVKIVDFGLARRLGDHDVLQEDFTMPHGTPYYAAPEQLDRYRDEPRTDLYSLGMIFYEMLTSRLPFEKSYDLKRVRRRLKVDPIPPRQFQNDIPIEIEHFILKSLDRIPEGRHTSARDFIHTLDGIGRSGAKIQPAVPQKGAPLPQCPLRSPPIQSGANPHGMVVAVDDNDQADIVVEAALQEAIVTGTTVTLLTVVSGDRSDDFTRYGDEVRGNRWGRRMERFAQRFKHFGIDPTVRIRTGAPAEVIIETAKAVEADLLIMGPSNKKLFKHLFGGRTVSRVLKKAPCRIMVAQDSTPPRFPYDADLITLTESDLRGVDYFLSALWIQQLNWLAAVVQGLLSEPLISEDPSIKDNPVNGWIEKIRTYDQWRFLHQWVEAPQSSLDKALAGMVAAVEKGDDAKLRSIYLQEALPLLCRLREGMQSVSTAMREQAAIVEYQRVHMLDRATCPIDNDFQTTGGPIRQIQAIREYFCAHPDASPEQCLGWIDRNGRRRLLKESTDEIGDLF